MSAAAAHISILLDAAGNLRQIDLYGDLTCDGQIDESDDNAFKLLLSDPDGYAAAYPECNPILDDLDGSGVVDEADYELLAALLGTSTPRAERFCYDAENRLTLVYAPGFILRQQIHYDALRRRIERRRYTRGGGAWALAETTRHV